MPVSKPTSATLTSRPSSQSRMTPLNGAIAATPKPTTPAGTVRASKPLTGKTTSSNKKRPKSIKGRIKIKKIVEDPEIVHTMIDLVKQNDLQSIQSIVLDVDCKNKFNLYAACSDALVSAAALGYSSILEYLIEWGTQNYNTINSTTISTNVLANIQSGKLLQRAALYGHLNTVELLHRYGGDLLLSTEFTEITPLHYAAQHGRTDVVSYILKSVPKRLLREYIDRGVHPQHNAVYNGWSALHYASDNGHLDVVKLLVQYGCSIDQLNTTNDTACSIAAEHGKWSVVQYLIIQGASIDSSRRELTIVQWAVYRAANDAVQFLVAHGAQLKSIDDLQNITTRWLHPTETLYSIVRSEFSESIYKQLDLAIYRGLKVYNDSKKRVELIQSITWVHHNTQTQQQNTLYQLNNNTITKPMKHRLPHNAIQIILQYDENL